MTAPGVGQVIINADDFGLAAVNNAGIIAAYQNCVVSSASLMVGGDAAEEAIEFALGSPGLAVGLHVTFSDTRPVLPPQQVPLLVQPNGYFPPDERAHRLALLSFRGRRQVQAEIAAQFRAFHNTGLPWDHINVHRHAHQNNPLLAWLIFREATRWPVSATRVPFDPPRDIIRRLRAYLLRKIGQRCSLLAPDRSVGRDWTVPDLVDYLRSVPSGVTELYFHPVTTCNHRYSKDLSILLDARVKEVLGGGIALRGFRDIEAL